MKRQIIFCTIFVLCVLLSCSHTRKHSHESHSQPKMPELTIERARDALIEMMKESTHKEWGGTKEVAIEDDYFAGDSFDSDYSPEKKNDDPPRIPDIMNNVEYLADGKIRIGFWECDMQKKVFYVGVYGSDWYTGYEGKFTFNKSSGEWNAEFWMEAHGMLPLE